MHGAGAMRKVGRDLGFTSESTLSGKLNSIKVTNRIYHLRKHLRARSTGKI